MKGKAPVDKSLLPSKIIEQLSGETKGAGLAEYVV